jgi:hypothetical protein
MELLLNLLWLSLALGTLFAFVQRRRRSTLWAAPPYCASLIALAFTMVLLFPIVSASDDLHPAQAVVEDASKKIQLMVAPVHMVRTSAPRALLPLMLPLCMMVALAVLGPSDSLVPKGGVLAGAIIPYAGRAPPSSGR